MRLFGRLRRSLIVWMVLGLCALPSQTFAGWHPANVCSGLAKIQPDRSITLKLRFDMLAYILEMTPAEVADGPMLALIHGSKENLQESLADGKARMQRSLSIMGDGHPVSIGAISFPTADDVLQLAAAKAEQPLPLMMSISVSVKLPAGAKTVSMRFPEELGTVILSSEIPYTEPVTEPVEPGNASTALRIPSQKEVDALAKAMRVSDLQRSGNHQLDTKPEETKDAKPTEKSEEKVEPEKSNDGKSEEKVVPEKAGKPDEPSDATAVAQPSTEAQDGSAAMGITHIPWYKSFWTYIKLGFAHILPQGLDHILFVLGLFLLSKRTKDLIKQITAFTVAHSLTLALSLFGVFQLPASIVEPLIALSIAFVAIENLFTTEMKPWRPYVVFGFGLVHGLGFAGILQDLELPRSDYLTALLGFNLGVEFGQLSVVAGAMLLVGWFRAHEKYRKYVTMPASVLIAVMAIFWTVQRIFF